MQLLHRGQPYECDSPSSAERESNLLQLHTSVNSHLVQRGSNLYECGFSDVPVVCVCVFIDGPLEFCSGR